MTRLYCERVYKGKACGKPAVAKGYFAWFCAECWDILAAIREKDEAERNNTQEERLDADLDDEEL